jgi:hypothetical protein
MKIVTVEDEARNLPAVVVGRGVTHAEEREKAVLRNNLQTWYSVVRYHQNSEVNEHGRQVDNTGQANSSINVSMLTIPETIIWNYSTSSSREK